MSIISRLSGTGRAISFPAGKPPDGTCEFATETCLAKCGNRVPNFQAEYKAYDLFCRLNCRKLVSRLTAEIETSQNKVLSWFTESGDCPTKLTHKIINVMSILPIPQNGFTRNKELWKLSQLISNVRMVLTEENENIAHSYKEKGMVCVPNYYEQRVKIFKAGKIWLCGAGTVSNPGTPFSTCGCGSVETDNSESEEDCGLCFQLSRGCYAA